MSELSSHAEITRRQLIIGALGAAGCASLSGLADAGAFALQPILPIGKARLLHIPYFGMAAPGAASRRIFQVDSLDIVQNELGVEAVIRLRQTKGEQFLGLYLTRCYKPPGSARYQHWLVFRDPAAAENFLGFIARRPS